MISENSAGRDLSGQGGNPTSAIQAAYKQLMAIQDPNELVDAAMGIVQPLVGKGMSTQNFAKFKMNLMQSARRGLTNVQSFLSNYMLAGSGMGTSGSRGRMESIEQIANVITEDANVFRELTPRQAQLKRLVESTTNFKVVLLS